MAELLTIGCSTGGPKALQDLLPAIPKSLPVPCLIVQHMPASFTKPFAERLNSLCEVDVKEAEQGEPICPGVVYIAPGGIHLNYRQSGRQATIELNPEPAASLHRHARFFDGFQNAHVRPAAAQVAIHLFDNLVPLQAGKGLSGGIAEIDLLDFRGDGVQSI